MLSLWLICKLLGIRCPTTLKMILNLAELGKYSVGDYLMEICSLKGHSIKWSVLRALCKKVWHEKRKRRSWLQRRMWFESFTPGRASLPCLHSIVMPHAAKTEVCSIIGKWALSVVQSRKSKPWISKDLLLKRKCKSISSHILTRALRPFYPCSYSSCPQCGISFHRYRSWKILVRSDSSHYECLVCCLYLLPGTTFWDLMIIYCDDCIWI